VNWYSGKVVEHGDVDRLANRNQKPVDLLQRIQQSEALVKKRVVIFHNLVKNILSNEKFLVKMIRRVLPADEENMCHYNLTNTVRTP